MDKEETKYKVVNLMIWNDDEQADDVAYTSLTEEFTNLMCTDDSDIYPDQNIYVGKPRYFYITLKKIKKLVWEKDNIDLFCKHNPECYDKEFNIWNHDWDVNLGNGVIKYTPKK